MNGAAVSPDRGFAPLPGVLRDRALARWQTLRPHVEEGLRCSGWPLVAESG